MGGATARGAFCCQGHAIGGVAVGRSELEGAVRSLMFASGDIEMASHGEALVNLGGPGRRARRFSRSSISVA